MGYTSARIKRKPLGASMHWHTYRPKRPRKDRPSNTVRLEQLSDQELMTIRAEFSRLDEENLRIDAANRSAKYEHERLYGKYNRMRDLAYEYDMGVVSPLIQEKHRIMAELKPHKVGVISGILGDALIAHDERVKYRFKRNDATARLVAKLNEVFRKIAEGEAHHKHMLAPIPNHPLDHNVLKRKNNFSVKVVGSEYSVRYSETNNAARIDELLKKRQSQRDKKVEAQERQKNIEINNKNRQKVGVVGHNQFFRVYTAKSAYWSSEYKEKQRMPSASESINLDYC